jgi:hypothetical protein
MPPTISPKPCALIVLDRAVREWVYGDEITAELRRRVDLAAPPLDGSTLADQPEVLREVEASRLADGVIGRGLKLYLKPPTRALVLCCNEKSQCHV